MEHSSKPVKKFRAGHLEIAVWANEARDGDKVFMNYSCTMKKSIKVEGEWKETNVLFTNELPLAMILLNKAYYWIYFDRLAESN